MTKKQKAASGDLGGSSGTRVILDRNFRKRGVRWREPNDFKLA